LMTFQVFRLKTFLFLNGLLNRPPQIWRKGMKPAHPNDFK